jgi:hypothetical protein
MADKKISISADLKVKTTDAERVLQKLSKEGTKISQILKGLDINTSQGRAGFAKSLTTANKEMLKLRGTTHDTAKVMEHVYGRQLEKQSKNLDNYTKKLEKLNKNFRLQQAGFQSASAAGNTIAAGGAQSAMDRTANKITVIEAARQATQAAITALGGGGGGGGGNGPAPFDPDKWRNRIVGGQAIVGAIGNAAGLYQSGKTLESGNIANIRNFERNLLGRMAGGDFSDLYFANRKMQSGKTAGQFAHDEFGGTGAGSVQGAANTVDALLGTLGQVLSLGKNGGGAGGGLGQGAGAVMTVGDKLQAGGGIANGLGNGWSSARNNFVGGPQAQEVATMQQGTEFQKLQDPMSQAAIQFTQNTAGMRVGASKALQGRHMGAWGIGMGQGLDMGESMAMAMGLSRQFGVNATMGTGATSSVERQRFAMPHSSAEAAKIRDQITAAEGKGMSYRPGDGSVNEIIYGKNVRKAGQGSLMSSVLGLERMGMDRAVSGSALGTMQQAAGGIASANRQLEDVMTKAFRRGVTDARLGEEIVKATGEAAFGFGGAAKDMGSFGMMLSGGLDSNSTLRDVQANVGGFGAVSNLFQNNDYFKAIKAESAHNILGAGGTGTQMMASSKASLGELIRGSDMLDAAGITDEQRKQMFNQSANSLMGSFLTNGNDPQTAGLRSALGSNGGDIVGALQGKGNKRIKGKNFGELDQQFALAGASSSNISFEEWIGFARDMQGFGSKAETGKGRQNYGPHGDSSAESTVRAQQQVLNELFKQEIAIREDYLKALKAAPKVAETIAMNEPGLAAFKTFYDEFLKIMQKAMADPRFRQGIASGGKAGSN